VRKEPFVWDLSVSMLSVVDDDGFMGVQPEVYGDSPSMVPFELHHSFGFVARPRDPDVDDNSTVEPGGGCTILTATEGDKSYAWLAGDPRYVAAYPEPKKGGSCQYGATGTFGSIDGEDGTWTKYVPCEFDANGTATKAHLIQAGLDPLGKRVLSFVHSDGMAVTMVDETVVIQNAAGDVYLQVDADGVVINGSVKVVGGFDVGEATFPLAKYAELATWAGLVTAAINALPVPPAPPVPPLPLTCTTTMLKGF